ncbi:MAG: HD domain-containing protein [Campylobacteraceae bacterium]|nr:HD domain-containing protein [Campylobacteraceae bacterium]
MNIKNRIKISFVAVISLVLLISFTAVFVTYIIRKNSILNSQISQIILLQEKMNQAIQDADYSNTAKKIDLLKDKFNQYEYSFEKIKSTISIKENINFLSKIFKDTKEKQKIIENLKNLFINEHKIEVTFHKMYVLQEKYIKAKKEFDRLYPKEKRERVALSKKIFLKNNFRLIYYFGLTQYYSKETLYQHKTDKALNQWLDSIDSTKENLKDKLLINNLDNYGATVVKIGKKAIELKNIQNDKRMVQKKINSVLQNNKQLAINISQMTKSIGAKVTNTLFITLVGLTILIILFIIFLGLKVSKNVGLSVDEIEEKVKDGLKQIVELNNEVESTQREIIFTMGTIAEYRSKETGNHVKRVAEYSKILACHYGLNKEEAEMLKQASPMHDIGKIAIPDAILNKPGRFDEEERKIMNTHAFLGYEMLNKSQRLLLKTASIVAYEHHEKWDGSGYPRGLAGDKIHIYGRITALADVFDALGSDRVYKKAWDNKKIFKLFKEERGRHFEPKLIDIFFNNIDEFLQVQRTFKDV